MAWLSQIPNQPTPPKRLIMRTCFTTNISDCCLFVPAGLSSVTDVKGKDRYVVL